MNFKPAQFENFCKHPNPDIKCVILFGTNEGAVATLHKQCVEAVCGGTDDAFHYVLLDMENISKDGGEIYAEFYAQSLMGGRRVVAVKNADNNLTAFLKNTLPETTSENLLILMSDSLNTKSSLITWAKDRTDTIIVGCYEEREADIAKETEKLLAERGITADIPTMQALCARLSPDSKVNQGEIDKLATYLGDRKVVTMEDVQTAVSDVAGANIEDLCYFTAGGDVVKACNIYTRLLKEGNDPSMLIRQVSYHFNRLLISAATMLEEGKNADQVIFAMRPPLMFYRKDDYKRQLQMWSKERILSALRVLYDCERDCKTTGLPAEECGSYTIMRLAGAAQKLQQRR